jgi:hypothetical protein
LPGAGSSHPFLSRHLFARLQHGPTNAFFVTSRYGTLDQFKDEPHDYAAAVMLGISPSCEKAVVQMLVDICRKGTPSSAVLFALLWERARPRYEHALPPLCLVVNLLC